MTSGRAVFFDATFFAAKKLLRPLNRMEWEGRERARPVCVGVTEDTTPDAHAAEVAASRYRGEVCCGVSEKFRAGRVSAASDEAA
jgi:hypothetical protein